MPATRGSHPTLSACVTIALALYASAALPDDVSAPSWFKADRSVLCVTNGAVAAAPDGWLAIDTPSARAVVRDMKESPEQAAELRFRYLGPSQTERPLASGTLQRQIGVKLQAQDTCNTAYVMWHIEPDTRLAVSIKRNPGTRTQAACGARGYTFVKGEVRADPPPVHVGETNTLRVELHGLDLVVTANHQVAWRGALPGPLPAGPVGFETDNGRFLIDYQFADAGRAQSEPRVSVSTGANCRAAAGGN